MAERLKDNVAAYAKFVEKFGEEKENFFRSNYKNIQKPYLKRYNEGS